jgi:hypothetical protein
MSFIDDLPPEVLERVWADMEKRRKDALSKRLGRPVGEWGGKRKGAGRPKYLPYNAIVKLQLNGVQKKMLSEMGNGILAAGIEKLINEHM